MGRSRRAAGQTLRLAPSDLQRLAQPAITAKLATPELLRLRHVDSKPSGHAEAQEKSPCPCAHAVRRLERSPDPNGHYPIDPELLPPGYADRPMITVVHTVDGLATGGVTYLVSSSERKR